MSTPTTPKVPTPPTVPTMPTTTPTTPTTPTAASATKVCHIVKRADFDGYGFNLHSEKIKPGQFIGKVDAKSPAEAAGLKEGDRILEVNGVAIGNETHKQVVQRIKAIACEVRLLLIDVDGKGDAVGAAAAATASPTAANLIKTNGMEHDAHYEGIKKEMPGASANISTISMVSTKRSSNSSNMSGSDVTDRAVQPPTPPAAVTTVQVAPVVAPVGQLQNGAKPNPIPNAMNGNNEKELKPMAINNNNNNNTNNSSSNSNMLTPPPPSAAVATVQMSTVTKPTAAATTTATAGAAGPTSAPMTNNNNNNNAPAVIVANGNSSASAPAPATSVNRPGSLNLTMTAAEMRAKLMSKKKYDPKNESVDLKKKFEIIQKL